MSKKKHQSADQSAFSLARRGTKALDRANYERSIRDLTKALDPAVNPSLQDQIKQALAEAHFRRGQRLLFENTDLACVDLVQAAELQPGDSLYAYHVALAYHRLGSLDEAIAWYETAMRRDPSFERARFPLALALIEKDQDIVAMPLWEELVEDQRALLQRKPGEDPLTQGLDLAARGDWQTARISFEKALGETTPPKARGLIHYYLGVVAAGENDVTGALEHWRNAYNDGLDTPDLIYNLTLACILAAENRILAGAYADALEYTQIGLGVDPGQSRLLDIEAHCYLALGVEDAQHGRWSDALATWEMVTESSGMLARSLAANSAIAYEKMERWEEAAEAWREYARRRPHKKNSLGYLNDEQVGRLWARVAGLYQRAGISEEAVATLQNALKYDPANPTLNLSLVRTYLNNDQPEAAENRLNRFLKKHPDHPEALCLKAEFSEAYANYFWIYRRSIPGIKEWEAVEATGDETYAPLARQRLAELHQQSFDRNMLVGHYEKALAHAQKALVYSPYDHLFRARYVRALLMRNESQKKIEEQISQIDLTDLVAATELVGGYYFAGRPDEAEAILKKIEEKRPLPPEAFVDLGNMALSDDDDSLAEAHFAEALERAKDREEIKHVKNHIASAYYEVGNHDQAHELWNEIIAEDEDYGPTRLALCLLASNRFNRSEAKEHLRRARRWARRCNDREMLEVIKGIEQIISDPFGPMFDMFEGPPF